MTNFLIKYITVFLTGIGALGFVLIVSPRCAWSWTSAHIFSVDVTVGVARSGRSTVTTEVRFIVEGGQFHGFELVDLPGAVLVAEESRAVRDDGMPFNVAMETLRDGRQRMILADDQVIKRGGITFKLVHQIDFLATGALRPYEGRARLDWTPLIWDEGIDHMNVQVKLSGVSEDGLPAIDQAVARDYIVNVATDAVSFTKYGPVRWYPMQVVVSFDPKLVPELSLTPVDNEEPTLVVAPASVAPLPPKWRFAVMPTIVGLVGFLVLLLKARHVRRAYRQVGREARFTLLTHTAFCLRCALGVAALAIGLGAQHLGYLAAGIPALTAAAAFFVMRRDKESVKLRPGGVWRKMTEDDLLSYGTLVKAYRRTRVSMMDITTLRGMLCFGAYLLGLAYLAYITRHEASRIAWAVVIDGLILGVPAWLGSIRGELPVDATLEGFYTLKRWQKSLSKMIGAKTAGGSAELFVREDKEGPIDVRLRAGLPLEGINNIEMAGEVVLAGSLFRTRAVFVFRLVPGTAVTRQLARSPYAAEHHLTPDLQEEIIVLRNRRGRSSSDLSPIRGALALLSS